MKLRIKLLSKLYNSVKDLSVWKRAFVLSLSCIALYGMIELLIEIPALWFIVIPMMIGYEIT